MVKKRKGKRPGQQILRPEDVKRAIFVDYEKSMTDVHPTTLFGMMVERSLTAAIVDPLFAKQCGGRFKAKHALAGDHVQTLLALIGKAEIEDRVIVSWSEHDYHLMRAALTAHAKAQTILRRRFRNGIFTSRKWHRKEFPDIQPRNDLATVAKLCGYKIPRKYGTGLVGPALALIRNQLTQGRGYAELTVKARKGWQTVVRHNAHDLRAMAFILRHEAIFLKGIGGAT